jgi:hypothetical protein
MMVLEGGVPMRAEELAAEFGIAGVLEFVETEHGLVKTAISLDGAAGELYLQGAQVTAWQPRGEQAVGPIHQPQQRIRAGKGYPRRHPNRLPVVRRQSADADGTAARLRTHRRVASRRGGNRRQRVAHLDPQPRGR